MKKLFIAYWVLVVVGAVVMGATGDREHIDTVAQGLALLNLGLAVGAFFIALFKIFRVIRRVNPPTMLNLVYWLVSFALFAVNVVWFNHSESTSASISYYYTYYPESLKASAVMALWAVVSGCWIGFNRYTKNK